MHLRRIKKHQDQEPRFIELPNAKAEAITTIIRHATSISGQNIAR